MSQPAATSLPTLPRRSMRAELARNDWDRFDPPAEDNDESEWFADGVKRHAEAAQVVFDAFRRLRRQLQHCIPLPAHVSTEQECVEHALIVYAATDGLAVASPRHVDMLSRALFPDGCHADAAALRAHFVDAWTRVNRPSPSLPPLRAVAQLAVDTLHEALHVCRAAFLHQTPWSDVADSLAPIVLVAVFALRGSPTENVPHAPRYGPHWLMEHAATLRPKLERAVARRMARTDAARGIDYQGTRKRTATDALGSTESSDRE